MSEIRSTPDKWITSIALWENLHHFFLRDKGEMEDIGGIALFGDWVYNRAVDSDLNVLAFGITNL